MRALLALALLALLLPGCTKDADPPAEVQTPVETHAPAPLPQDIHANDSMPPSADPTSLGTPECAPSATCLSYPFDVQGNASVTADLAWDVPANDLDLFLMQDGDIVESSTNSAPASSEHLEAVLGPGSYELVVQGYASGPQPFTLDATFAP